MINNPHIIQQVASQHIADLRREAESERMRRRNPRAAAPLTATDGPIDDAKQRQVDRRCWTTRRRPLHPVPPGQSAPEDSM